MIRVGQLGEGGTLMGRLGPTPPDSLLALIGAFRADRRPDKIDIGVGVYRDEAGRTPVMAAVKEAERRLLEQQDTKAYLGPEGDIGFFEALRPLVFGRRDPGERAGGLQTPGGTGALRLGFELVARADPAARVWVGQPTWPNHPPIIAAAGLEMVPFSHFDVARQEKTFDRAMAELAGMRRGDVILLHGCCHNPTGADLTPEEWTAIAGLVADRGAFPFIDLAYQGLGRGLDEDAAGVGAMLETVGEALVAYSCDKNFGLYRERTGALLAVSADGDTARTVQLNLLSLARAAWSMPPDHGAAAVRLVLEDAPLRERWRSELAGMRDRLFGIRRQLAALDPALAVLTRQHGMFATLPVTPPQVAWLRAERGIYMPSSGRVNLAGLLPSTVEPFVQALADARLMAQPGAGHGR